MATTDVAMDHAPQSASIYVDTTEFVVDVTSGSTSHSWRQNVHASACASDCARGHNRDRACDGDCAGAAGVCVEMDVGSGHALQLWYLALLSNVVVCLYVYNVAVYWDTTTTPSRAIIHKHHNLNTKQRKFCTSSVMRPQMNTVAVA